MTSPSNLRPEALCWVCHDHRNKVWKARSESRPLTPEDLQITDSRYGSTLTLLQCEACGFIFADGEEVRQLVSLYEQLDDPEYEVTQDTRALQMEWLLDQTLEGRPWIRSWLDIGAGAGILVAAAKRRGIAAQGVEPSRSLVAAAGRVNGVTLKCGIFPHPDLSGQDFSVISLVDVIEHVSDPVGLLRDCAGALSGDGLLLLVTPDIASPTSKLLGRRWWHLRLAHVGYFSRDTLTLAAAQAGLEPVEWFRARWFFRSYYLAERLAQYIPIGRLCRWAANTRIFGPLFRLVVRLNLRDSWVVLLRRSKAISQ